MASQASPSSTPRRIANLVFVRLLGFVFVLAAAAVLATAVTHLLIPPAPAPGHQWIFLKNLLLPVLLIVLYGLAVRFLERRDPAELSLAAGAKLFPLGLASGVAFIALYVLALIMLGAAHVAWGSTSQGAMSEINAFVVPWLASVGEELIFRLILFRLIEEALGTGLAVLISAAIFGVAHAGNPGVNAQDLLLLACGFGLLTALAYVATRNLWAVVGLHMGWNLAEGSLFGLPNSGMQEPVTWLQTTLSGSPQLTGGAFGPEGSLPLFMISLLGVAALFWLVQERGQWRSLRGALQVLRSS